MEYCCVKEIGVYRADPQRHPVGNEDTVLAEAKDCMQDIRNTGTPNVSEGLSAARDTRCRPSTGGSGRYQ